MIVMNGTFTANGRSAMCRTARATSATSITGSTRNPAVGLRHALGKLRRHIGQRIADVDLPAGDIERAPIQAQRAGQPGHRMFRHGVGR